MRFVRPDVQIFLERMKALGGRLSELGPEAGRRDSRA